jgi:hypothetical protein
MREITILIEPDTKKYKFIAIGSYWKYMYHKSVWTITIPPSIPVTGTTVFTSSLPVSVDPTIVDKKYAAAIIKPTSAAPRTVTIIDRDSIFCKKPIISFKHF